MANTTLQLDLDTRDLVFADGDLKLVHGDDTVAQCARCALLTWLGEWDFDATVGVDYDVIFNAEGITDMEIERVITAAIYQETDVRSVDSMAVTRTQRGITVSFSATLVSGATISSEVSTNA